MLYKKIFATSIAMLMTGSAQVAWAQSGEPVSMTEAIEVAMSSNPQIAQAQYNKEAIQFERKQAQGLFLPRVNVEASAGIRRLENTTRRTLGIANQEIYPLEIQGRGEWVAIDFGRRRGELLNQASRVDGASLRVLERSEYVALQVARQYLDVLLQQRVLAASEDNVTFHRQLVGDLTTGVEQGSISIADQQQAEERLQSALVRQSEAEQTLIEAKNSLKSLTGLDIENVQVPPVLAENMPISIDEAVGLTRMHNPLVKEARADVDASNAMAKGAKGDLFPEIGVDVTGRYGEDIDGFKGTTKDIQGRVFMRWDIFDGGINRAKYQEMVRRSSQSRYRLYEIERQAEEDVRNAWTALQTQGTIVEHLTKQSQVSDDLLLSYRSQFNVGRRSLLDVLDAQNSRFNVQVRLETARFSEMFARYQTLASANRFLESLNVAPGAGAGEAERERFNYGPSAPAELQYRTLP